MTHNLTGVGILSPSYTDIDLPPHYVLVTLLENSDTEEKEQYSRLEQAAMNGPGTDRWTRGGGTAADSPCQAERAGKGRTVGHTNYRGKWKG